MQSRHPAASRTADMEIALCSNESVSGPSADQTQVNGAHERRAASSMMMAAGAVYVTVRKFFFGRGADFSDLDFKVQILSGERMVTVHRDHIAGNPGHRDGSLARI